MPFGMWRPRRTPDPESPFLLENIPPSRSGPWVMLDPQSRHPGARQDRLVPYLLRVTFFATVLASLAVMFLPTVQLFSVEGDPGPTVSLFSEYPAIAVQAGVPPVAAVALAWIFRVRALRFLGALVLWVWGVMGAGTTPITYLFVLPALFLTIAAFSTDDA